ncbi:MAG: tRNA lysidine(34) synthetase TilS [Flavobacteriaceae bacterium]
MEQRFRDHIASLLDVATSPKILVAVSGGVDSIVLAHLLFKCGYDFEVAHVNYKLRGSDSDLDEKLVSKLAASLQVPFHCDTRPIDPNESGIQEKARDLRYAWFKELVATHDFDAVLTAHHADDQLETLFMRLSRGSGVEGLGGIRAKNGFLIRPLLPFFKEEITAYAKANDLIWRDDVSNSSKKYLRNAIRHDVMPAFLNLSPQTATNTLMSMQHLQDAFKAIDIQINSIKQQWKRKKDRIVIPLATVQHLRPRGFWLHHLFSSFGFDAVEVEKLLATHSGKKCVSATHELLRERDHLVLSTNTVTHDSLDEHYLVSEKGLEYPVKIQISNSTKNAKSAENSILVDGSKLSFPLVLRRWDEGDVFYPTGMKGKKKLSKFFKDEKMSAVEKKNQWVLCHKNDVIWIVGKRLDRRFVADDFSESLQIKIG